MSNVIVPITPTFKEMVKKESQVFDYYKDLPSLVFAWMQSRDISLTDSQIKRIESLELSNLEYERCLNKAVLAAPIHQKDILLDILVDSFKIDELTEVVRKMMVKYLNNPCSERDQLMIDVVFNFFLEARKLLSKNGQKTDSSENRNGQFSEEN